MSKKESAVVIIKKYANRRLYDTDRSAYITLDDLCDMVKKDVQFQVLDAKTNEDLTRSVLTQIIFEQESRGYNILPINFLRQVIKFYDDSLRTVLPSYLETMMEYFTRNQDKVRGFMTPPAGVASPFKPFQSFEDIGRQNIELIEQTMNMWSKFNPMFVDMFKDDKGDKKK